MKFAAYMRTTKTPFSAMDMHMSFEVFLVIASVLALAACEGSLIEWDMDSRMTSVAIYH